MYCERCAEQDRVTLGTDEGHAHPQWSILCDACKRELDEDRAADAQAAEDYARQLHNQPVTKLRQWWRRGGEE